MSATCKRIRRIPRLAARAPDAHKGRFGRVLVVGGNVGMAGAPSLVGLAALRSGAGLATIATPASIQPTTAAICPCATTIALPETADGRIDPPAARRALEAQGWLDPAPRGTPPDALVIGPGVGRGSPKYGHQLWELIDAFRHGAGVPAVIDADALNLTHRTTPDAPNGWDQQDHRRTVITPHPGELARMLEVTIRDIQDDRQAHAVRTAREMNARKTELDESPVVVLKGAGTIVTDGTRIYTNRTGNPGMATGGSGDVLAGMIGALIGQGMTCFDAAVAGVHLHGLAGDLAARRLGQVSLIATDIIDALPAAFLKKNSPRRR